LQPIARIVTLFSLALRDLRTGTVPMFASCSSAVPTSSKTHEPTATSGSVLYISNGSFILRVLGPALEAHGRRTRDANAWDCRVISPPNHPMPSRTITPRYEESELFREAGGDA